MLSVQLFEMSILPVIVCLHLHMVLRNGAKSKVSLLSQSNPTILLYRPQLVSVLATLAQHKFLEQKLLT